MKSFRVFADANQAAKELVKDLGSGSQKTALTSKQAIDALAAFEQLDNLYRSTGRRVSLLAAVSEFAGFTAKLNGGSPGEAIAKYLDTVAAVKRVPVSEAVDQFIAAEEPRTKAANGERPQLSPKFHYNRSIMLRRFAAAFPGAAVCDLSKGSIDAFMGGLGKIKSKSRNGRQVVSAKGRNHYRASIQQFLSWAVRKDYLPVTHRLGEADSLRREKANTAKIEFYTPAEFKDLLAESEGRMRAMIAIGGLAGLRTQELLRLDWADVWRTPRHIEVIASKSKTRQRRLVEICPTLESWLKPFRKFKSGSVCELNEITWHQHFVKVCANAGVKRKSNGLRHAFCTYGFSMRGEIWTAEQAGTSPSMLHAHYRGLAVRSEACTWFYKIDPPARRSKKRKPSTAPENVIRIDLAKAR